MSSSTSSTGGSARARRSEQLLSKLGDKLGMTEAGKAAVTLMLDPFHDNPVKFCGYPDGAISKNVNQVIKQSMTIVAPPGLAAGALWDCSIVDWPWETPMTGTRLTGDVANGFTVSSVAGINTLSNDFASNFTRQIGGLTAYTTPSGGGMNAFSQLTSSGSTSLTNMRLPSLYNNGKRRVVAKGFEVYNTSAELYKGGTVCVWTSPVPDITDAPTINYFLHNGATGQAFAGLSTSAIEIESPPAGTAAALLLAGSKQWDATKGCYVPGRLHSEDIPTNDYYPVVPLIVDNTWFTVNGNPTPAVIGEAVQSYVEGVSGVTVLGFQPLQFTQFDMTGAMFTGLTQQSTLTVNWNIVVERFPSNQDLDLVVLAVEPPERDDVAIRFLSHALSELPVGVPVDMNGLGDWF